MLIDEVKYNPFDFGSGTWTGAAVDVPEAAAPAVTETSDGNGMHKSESLMLAHLHVCCLTMLSVHTNKHTHHIKVRRGSR